MCTKQGHWSTTLLLLCGAHMTLLYAATNSHSQKLKFNVLFHRFSTWNCNTVLVQMCMLYNSTLHWHQIWLIWISQHWTYIKWLYIDWGKMGDWDYPQIKCWEAYKRLCLCLLSSPALIIDIVRFVAGVATDKILWLKLGLT